MSQRVATSDPSLHLTKKKSSGMDDSVVSEIDTDQLQGDTTSSGNPDVRRRLSLLGSVLDAYAPTFVLATTRKYVAHTHTQNCTAPCFVVLAARQEVRMTSFLFDVFNVQTEAKEVMTATPAAMVTMKAAITMKVRK